MFHFAVFDDTVRPHLNSTLGTGPHDDVSGGALLGHLVLPMLHPHVAGQELLHHVISAPLALYVTLNQFNVVCFLSSSRGGIVAHPIGVVHVVSHHPHLHTLHAAHISQFPNAGVFAQLIGMGVSHVPLEVGVGH